MLATVSKHWAVLRSAWVLDTEEQKTRRKYIQTEFLPAALEVIETPASPFGRVGLWVLVVGVGIALLWAFLGKLDVVVVAPGKITPVDQVKIIQPVELGVVKAIHVRDGQQVKKGQLLIELDPTASRAEDDQARTGLLASQIDAARSDALLAYLNGGSSHFNPPSGIPEPVIRLQSGMISAQIKEFEARRAMLQTERAEHVAELAAANAERQKLNETLPLLEKQIEARKLLVEKGYFPRLRLFELEEQRIERVRNIDVQTAAAAKANASIRGVDAQLRQMSSELASTTVSALAEAQDNTVLRRSEIDKTELRKRLMKLRSPVDGTVQQLAIHTLGGVVEPAQAIMVIVPKGSKLVVDAKVPNKDIGFLKVGQTVRVKVDAFSFTDYGTIEGKLLGISRDAIEDEKLGLIYSVRVALHQQAIDNRISRQILSPGMAVAAEIKTGKRRVIQYFLSPISRRLDEAGRER